MRDPVSAFPLRGAGLGAILLGGAACAHVHGEVLASDAPGTPLQDLDLGACVSGAVHGLGRGVILRSESGTYEVGFFQEPGRVPGTLVPAPSAEVILHNRETGQDLAFSSGDCRVLEGALYATLPKGYNAVEALSGNLRLQCGRDGAAVWGSVSFEGCAL